MKCPNCNGTGYSDTQRYTVMTEFPPCPWCGGSGYVKDNEQTNEKWFNGLSTIEKAKWFADNFGFVAYKASGGKPETVQEQFIEYWQEWLKQPHR